MSLHRLSLLLFSGSIAMVYCSIKLKQLLHGEKRRHGRSRLFWMFPDFRDSKDGELITSGGRDSNSDLWRSYVSDDFESAKECQLEVTNCGEMMIMCWVDTCGMLHNFYTLADGSIKDKSVVNIHTEFTQEGHCFVWYKLSERIYKNICELPEEDFIAVYRPLKGDCRHVMSFSKSDGKLSVKVTCIPLKQGDPVIDTSDKEYLIDNICGFTIRYEHDVFSVCPEFRSAIETDFSQVVTLIPCAALLYLQKNVCFWINTSLTYGRQNKPIKGSAMCFHPDDGVSWLRRHGLSAEKAGGIELYCPFDYVRTRGHWGDGGVLLHELAHAFHNKCCADGFDNCDIREAYSRAMSRKLYDCVPVHGPQGKRGPIKAYACANCMEFWAELSVALLYSGDEEYNKWFPHNRRQLLEHDPDTFSVMQQLWGLKVDKEPLAPSPGSDRYGLSVSSSDSVAMKGSSDAALASFDTYLRVSSEV